jgi:hypothetical protein
VLGEMCADEKWMLPALKVFRPVQLVERNVDDDGDVSPKKRKALMKTSSVSIGGHVLQKCQRDAKVKSRKRECGFGVLPSVRKQ